MASQRFCLRWNNHQSNLLTVFDQLLHAETFTDVTLAIDGQYLKAHKVCNTHTHTHLINYIPIYTSCQLTSWTFSIIFMFMMTTTTCDNETLLFLLFFQKKLYKNSRLYMYSLISTFHCFSKIKEEEEKWLCKKTRDWHQRFFIKK